MNVDREGIFKAAPNAGLSLETSKDGAVCVSMNFALTDYLNGDQWMDWAQYGQHVYGRLWFIKKDGSTNPTAIATLKDVIGWDGDPASLATLQTPAVQLTVKNEPYNGKDSFKADWINPVDYVPQAKSVAKDDISKLASLHGAKLRAAFGPTKATPKPSPKPGTLPPPPTLPGCTKDDAWAAFEAQGAVLKLSEEAIANGWRNEIGQRDEATMTGADWLRIRNGAAESLKIPF